MPDARPLAGGSLLPCRPESRRTTRPHRTPASPRTEDEVLRPEHLARTFRGVGLTPDGGHIRVSDVNVKEGSPKGAGSNTPLYARVQS